MTTMGAGVSNYNERRSFSCCLTMYGPFDFVSGFPVVTEGTAQSLERLPAFGAPVHTIPEPRAKMPLTKTSFFCSVVQQPLSVVVGLCTVSSL